jgi:TPR repeat protein
MSAADWAHPGDEEMNASKVTHLIHALALAAFLSTFGTIGAAAQSPAQIEDWRKRAEQGNASAQRILGVIYENGDGIVRQDYKLAVHWYRKAAEQGYAMAQWRLGWMYYIGQGVPQNHKLAVHWFRKAAEQGMAWAQSNLGVMYDKGEGVPRNQKLAAHWYRKAAWQGDVTAQYKLGYDPSEFEKHGAQYFKRKNEKASQSGTQPTSKKHRTTAKFASPALKEPAARKCRVWTASYGGQKATIIRSNADSAVNYTVLDLNKGREDAEAKAYIAAYAKGGRRIGDFASKSAAMDKAFKLCPE